MRRTKKEMPSYGLRKAQREETQLAPISDIEERLAERRNRLCNIVKLKECQLQEAPKGKLHYYRTGKNRDKVSFYHRTSPKERAGKYLGKQQFALAKQLSQKMYDERVLAAAKREIRCIDAFLDEFQSERIEQLYDDLPRAMREIVTPVTYDDAEFARRWESEIYTGKDFYDDMPEFYTDKGERVRSKSEVLIANALHRHGIPYRYEYPLNLDDGQRVYPDFQIFDVARRKVMYWEHCGMMGAEEYAQMAITKIRRYTRNGYVPGENLILSFETAQAPLSTEEIDRTIEVCFGPKKLLRGAECAC